MAGVTIEEMGLQFVSACMKILEFLLVSSFVCSRAFVYADMGA